MFFKYDEIIFTIWAVAGYTTGEPQVLVLASISLVIYCKENNITWGKHHDIFVKMHFKQEMIVANNNKDINFAYDEYRKIRDGQDENSLKAKLTILSSLENHMDHWISLRQNNNGKKISLNFQDKFLS